MDKVDTNETEQQSAQPDPQEPAAQPVSPPKSQLRRRVDARLAELVAVLEKLEADPAKQKQANAIRFALKGAHDSLNLDSASTGQMQAAQMTRWLESTQYLLGLK